MIVPAKEQTAAAVAQLRIWAAYQTGSVRHGLLIARGQQ
jgi:hypothetical protein